MYDPSDAVTARYLLVQSLAMTTKPTLSEEQVDALMTWAASTDAVTEATVYTEANLNAAAAKGWEWKQGLVSDKYDLGGGPGRTLTRSQWFRHCEAMADAYATGRKSVAGTPQRSAGSGTIGLTTTLGLTGTE